MLWVLGLQQKRILKILFLATYLSDTSPRTCSAFTFFFKQGLKDCFQLAFTTFLRRRIVVTALQRFLIEEGDCAEHDPYLLLVHLGFCCPVTAGARRNHSRMLVMLAVFERQMGSGRLRKFVAQYRCCVASKKLVICPRGRIQSASSSLTKQEWVFLKLGKAKPNS